MILNVLLLYKIPLLFLASEFGAISRRACIG